MPTVSLFSNEYLEKIVLLGGGGHLPPLILLMKTHLDTADGNLNAVRLEC